ncbi:MULTISPECIES: hypothetical protein [unclassified Streptomyces]|uniref:hypothetical protein n=1 Tax=unclassified Streptomyces TaxID=2593676 RepID=UPI0004C59B77|nr:MULTISPECIES: hypothetical protein [unclassified Streptomyces]KOX01971.1 hypothetical protein ADL02_00285 [Streptomyces sp. NRRL WC-3723]
MDLDAVADELYGLRPEEFVATRDRRALDARKAGDQALAKEIGALRRPSLAAWVSNLLVRRQPEQVQPLLGLGEELRRAHRELDGTQLRKLARRQNEVIGALGRQARQLAAQAGHPVGEGVQREVEETLHAALADPEAAREWAAGRLVKPLSSMIGFPAADEVLLGRRPTPEPRKPARGKGREEVEGRKEDQARQEDQARKEREDREKEEQRRRLAEAREAERELRAQQEEADAAARAVAEAGARRDEAEERVRELRERLRDAEEEQQRTRAAERDARDRERQAGRAVREARRRAEKAAAELERPAAGTGSHG